MNENISINMMKEKCTVEPIYNDISNSDNYCYNDRFTNPRFFPLFESYNLFLQ